MRMSIGKKCSETMALSVHTQDGTTTRGAFIFLVLVKSRTATIPFISESVLAEA